MTEPLTTAALLARGLALLAGAIDLPRLDAELLLAHSLGVPRTRLKSHPEELRQPQEAAHYLQLVARRAAGEPLAYITGTKDFWSLSLQVDPAVLVPRPETELLVERGLALVTAASAQALDLGTGSGAIALALASERPRWQVTAVDASARALAVARANAQRLALPNVRFVAGNWFEPLAAARFDLIVGNPPYIAEDDPALPALRFEPRSALTAGSDGLADLAAIIRAAPGYLQPGGWLALEHGATQAPAVAAALTAAGFKDVRSHPDLAGHPRVTEGRMA